MPTVTEKAGELHCLRDVLQRWGVAEERWARMSPKWRCRLAPYSDTEDAVLANLMDERPNLPLRRYVDDVHGSCGADGLSMMLKGAGNDLRRPKLAFNSSWGVPGADLIHEGHLTVVKKLSEVFDHDDPTPRNLQMFHRNTPDEPNIPVLPSLFSWPEFLEATTVPCDKATRFSQRNALTTWHLDDCGEFVFQTALKVPAKESSLIGPNGLPVVKLFFCMPRWAYDMVTQDQEQNRTMTFAQLDLWGERCERLPPAQDLPVVTLCLIEAGGRPLLMYPNVAHTVLTVDDSVLVEERRVSKLFLDEVAYFHFRSRQSTQPPIYYDFVSQDCADPDRVRDGIVAPLCDVLERASESGVLAQAASQLSSRSDDALRRRAAASLLSLLLWDDVFSLHPADAERVRSALARAAGGPVDPKAPPASLVDARFSDALELIPGTSNLPNGVAKHYPTGRFFAYFHIAGSPVFGPMRGSVGAATSDRKHLAARLEYVKEKDNPDIQKALDELPPEAGPSAAAAAPPAADVQTQALLDELF